MSIASSLRALASLVSIAVVSVSFAGSAAFADDITQTSSSTQTTEMSSSTNSMSSVAETSTTTTSTTTVATTTTATTINAVSITSSNANHAVAKSGDMITVSVSTMGGTDMPVIMIDGHSPTIMQTGANAYSASYMLSSSDPAGTVALSASVDGQTVTSTTDGSSVTFDMTQPTGMFSSSASYHTNDNPIPFALSFSEPVLNLTASLLQIGNGTAQNLQMTSATNYTFDVVPGAPTGSVSVHLNGDQVTDAAGNYNMSVANIERIIDPSLPNNYVTDKGSSTGTTTGTGGGTGTGTGTTTDTTAPTLSGGSAIGTSTSSTPTFSFTSSEAGTITYGGACTSTTTAAVAGSNTITLNSLANGTYSDCTLAVTDAAGNMSGSLAFGTFTVDAPATGTTGGSSGSTGTLATVDQFSEGAGSGPGYGHPVYVTTTTTSTSGAGATSTTNGGSTGSASGSGSTHSSGTGTVSGSGTVTDTSAATTSDLYATTTGAGVSTTDGSQAAGVGFAGIPKSIWALIVILVAAVLGGTWYYRRTA